MAYCRALVFVKYSLLVFVAFFSVIEPSWSQEEAPASVRQFEQWLQKNGYGNESAATADQANSASSAASVASPALPAATPANGSPVPTGAQAQQSLLNTLPSSRVPDGDAEKAFDALLKQNMPLSSEQVIELHQQVDLAQRAAAVPPMVPPKPVSTTLMINLAPGSTPPAIRLAQGYVTSLVFVDSTGAAWPIAAYEIGNPKATNIQWDGKSNILLLQAVNPYSNGNLVIRLVSLPTPITLELISGQRVVDFRADIHVTGLGPNAKEVPSGSALPGSANQVLMNILDGIAPANAKTLVIKGGDCQGWLLGDTMYLRTRFTVLSPGWIGKMTSSDGMQAYEMSRSASVLISRYGEPVELKIEGF